MWHSLLGEKKAKSRAPLPQEQCIIFSFEVKCSYWVYHLPDLVADGLLESDWVMQALKPSADQPTWWVYGEETKWEGWLVDRSESWECDHGDYFPLFVSQLPWSELLLPLLPSANLRLKLLKPWPKMSLSSLKLYLSGIWLQWREANIGSACTCLQISATFNSLDQLLMGSPCFWGWQTFPIEVISVVYHAGHCWNSKSVQMGGAVFQ